MRFNKLIPELTVTNIEKSKEFYTEILGFKIEYERKEDNFVFLSLGEAQLMLDGVNENWVMSGFYYPFGSGVNFQIEIDNIEQFVAKIKEKEIDLYKDIFESKYKCGDITYTKKEVMIIDPDGYMLRFSEMVETRVTHITG